MLYAETRQDKVNSAFSKQASHYDKDDFLSPTLQRWRQQVHTHVDQFIKPNSTILELNAGTGIDAIRFTKRGHRVHATDLSDGMVRAITKKVIENSLQEKISIQQVQFERLDLVNGKYDFVFSNFGGLNCLRDLSIPTRQLYRLLNKDAYITWVIMPPVCLWEWSWIFKGEFKKALRRLGKTTLAHLEGEFFVIYYHSLNDVIKALGSKFKLVRVESLGVFSPPPSATGFIRKYSSAVKFLTKLDHLVKNHFPFNRWGDHLIVSFQYLG